MAVFCVTGGGLRPLSHALPLTLATVTGVLRICFLKGDKDGVTFSEKVSSPNSCFDHEIPT